ncbi:MAG: sugar phosphate isomerase/epimerase [Phycisphaerae bacterium]|jgi:sugar phosphate isomerase/epimerase|nr:sugar phosphate isomerase/epimerase [Phycisphaerae bacterium]MCZ2399483.1 sugar phosphate isomerase/epimerase [Phycisphaerae bacterium]NUQ50521.1 sugar phosphate isomerase/epimerase [Phycisphaerae bacterium]
MSQRVGVCSWSLQPKSPADLVDRLRATGLEAIQLALDPLGDPPWDMAITRRILREANVAILSGMIRTKGEDYTTLESIRSTGGVRSDENWAENLASAQRCAEFAEELELPLVTFHAGFLPPEPDEPLRAVMVERLRSIIDVFAALEVTVAFETGQETAQTLLDVLGQLERPTAGVNFDPANMLLYDHGDPVEALRLLAPHVRQIHIKDALRPTTPGEWGREAPVGQGQVDWPAFFEALKEAKLTCDLVIEREAASETLIEDIRAAHALVRSHLPKEGG